jgi:hypothetical protein
MPGSMVNLACSAISLPDPRSPTGVALGHGLHVAGELSHDALGFDPLEVVDQQPELRRALHECADRGRPRVRRNLTDISPTQQRLYDSFGRDRWAPRR